MVVMVRIIKLKSYNRNVIQLSISNLNEPVCNCNFVISHEHLLQHAACNSPNYRANLMPAHL